MTALLKYAAAPLLIAQGRRVRKTALIMPEAAGPRQGVSGNGPDIGLLMVGDSSAAGVGVDHQDAALLGQTVSGLAPAFTVSWALHAQTGATTASTLARLENVDAQPCDVAVIALGVNDVTSGMRLGKWFAQQNALLDLLTGKFGAKRIYVSGLPPVGDFPLLPQPLRTVVGREARRFDAGLKTLLRDRDNCRYVSILFPVAPELMAPDGFHPGQKVYRDWGRRVAGMITEDLPAISAPT